jgi:hypothetical protein
VFGAVSFNVSTVASALNTVNTLNTTLGGESGTNVSIGTGNGQTLTINASDGVLDGNGNRVFTVTGFNTTNNDVLKIIGDAAGDSVVFNFTSSANFNNQVALSGISSDQVLFNFVGGSGLQNGPTLQINDNASSSPSNVVFGVFLDPNGPVSVVNANVQGRVFGGDSHDFQYVSGSEITAPAVTVPVPAPPSILLALTGAVPLGLSALLRRRRLLRLAA